MVNYLELKSTTEVILTNTDLIFLDGCIEDNDITTLLITKSDEISPHSKYTLIWYYDLVEVSEITLVLGEESIKCKMYENVDGSTLKRKTRKKNQKRFS